METEFWKGKYFRWHRNQPRNMQIWEPKPVYRSNGWVVGFMSMAPSVIGHRSLNSRLSLEDVRIQMQRHTVMIMRSTLCPQLSDMVGKRWWPDVCALQVHLLWLSPRGHESKGTQREGSRNGWFQPGLRFLICTVACQVHLVHRILHASILEWVAISSSRGSSRPRDRTRVSSIAGGFFTIWGTTEPPSHPNQRVILASEDSF